MRLLHKLALTIVLMSLLAMLFPISVAVADDVVTFPDPNLEAAIRAAIGKPNGDIYLSDLANLTNLSARNIGISDLSGLEHCTSLTYLDLGSWQDPAPRNCISDISPLSGLTNLTELNLDFNQISDISPLAGLTNLTSLSLGRNQISDVSPLSGLSNLIGLGLEFSQISDISSLAGLTNLMALELSYSQVSDISPLSGLTKLTYLLLDQNKISNLSSLAGLTNLTALTLGGNPISDISPLSGLTRLDGLGLSDTQISDISPLTGLTSLISLSLQHTHIGDLSPLGGLINLIQLELSYSQIGDLSPVSGLTKLTWLGLSGTQISDLTPLAGLTGLTDLLLWGNQISDISPLSGLSELTWMCLSNNQISDVSVLAGLTSITYLEIAYNQISDIKPLVDNPGLLQGDTVNLAENPLSSTSVNAYIPQLQARGVTVYYTPSNQEPNQPTNVSPSNGAMGVTLTPTLQSSAFSDPDVGDTHAVSQWQVRASTGSYASPVFDSGTDTSNLTSINIPSGRLNYSTTYYWHVRHQDNHGDWSDWSAETSFTTALLNQVFQDHFDGTAIDSTIWNNVIATSGVRWRDIESEGHGIWELPPGAPAYGSINVGNSMATFTDAGHLPSVFPYIFSGPPSRTSPFPPTGDFILEVRVKYEEITVYGSGLVIRYWPNSDPVGNNAPWDLNLVVFQAWQDTNGLLIRLAGGGGKIIGSNDLDFHTYRLEYIGGIYSLFVDDALELGPSASSLRPDAIWMGNPSMQNIDWTKFTIDYIQVLQPYEQKPSQPTNISPTDGATVTSLTPTLQSSAFSDPDTGDTHAASQWQIRTSSGSYFSPVWDTGTDSLNLISFTIPAWLSYSTTYYWHVRHQDNHGAWSSWSAETSFTTRPPRIPPTVTTNNAGNVFSASAILRGNLDNLGTASSVDVSFQWTTDAHYGMHGDYDNETSPPWPMTSTGAFSYSLTGLSSDTTYHFRAIAVGDGTGYGNRMTFTTSGPGSDGDGVPASTEDAAPNGGDGNHDGIPDSQQADVASIPNAVNGGYATIESPLGTNLTNVAALGGSSLPSQGKPNLVFPQGFFSFDITGVPNGGTVWVNLRFENPVPAGSQYWKYGPTTDNNTPHWYQIPMNLSDGGHLIQIPLVDGGLGDDYYQLPDGIIVDQGGPGNPPSPGGGGASGVPIFPSIYVGIGAAMGAGLVAYFVRRRLIRAG